MGAPEDGTRGAGSPGAGSASPPLVAGGDGADGGGGAASGGGGESCRLGAPGTTTGASAARADVVGATRASRTAAGKSSLARAAVEGNGEGNCGNWKDMRAAVR